MRLNLSLNGVLVGSVVLDATRYKDEYYLEAMRGLLTRQCSELLSLIPATPLYYLEVPATAATDLFTGEQKNWRREREHLGNATDLSRFKTFRLREHKQSFSTN